MRTDDAPELLTDKQVAAIFQVNRATVSKWARDGFLPAVKVGKGTTRYRRDDVERLMVTEPKAAAS